MRYYTLKEGRKLSRVALKYHVWTVEGIPHDAYEVLGSTRVLSYHQVQDYIQSGVLTPIEDSPDYSIAA